MGIKFVEKAKIWISISLIVIIIGLGVIAFQGFNEGIDFSGGTQIYVTIGQPYDVESVRTLMSENDIVATVMQAGENDSDLIIRFQEAENQQEIQNNIMSLIEEKFALTEKEMSLEYVGSTVGKELTRNAILSLTVACVLILIYIWIRFELRSGVAAIIALIHDVLIMLSLTAILQVPINSPFIAALLTIIGYSINDTIIVFDRVRENNRRFGRRMEINEVVNKSINETIVRSLNTSFTTFLAVLSLYVFGVESIKEFTLPILVGIISGTYSSIFIASPIWVLGKKIKVNRKANS
jgi:preprotein translocase SecF subunit